MTSTSAFREWMENVQSHMETVLAAALPNSKHMPHRLHEAMAYAVLGGGKRVRPLLVFAAGEITNAPLAALEKVACAVEFIHAYSLVHDDLPCMDDDALRRGRPTCHIAYDEPTALLVGDGLQTQAFDILSASAFAPPIQQLEMVQILAHASGSRGMAGGQAIDLASVGLPLNQPELELMHALKTGALIRASILLGALCGQTLSADEREGLDKFAKRVGLLFQVVDDILDCTASTATLGKTAGKDQAHDKPTYVSLMGLEGAKQYAEDLRQQATTALSPLAHRAQRLQQLADFICHRQF